MTNERVDLDGLRMMVKNPHAYPIVMLTQGLEYCIAELEELREYVDHDHNAPWTQKRWKL